MRAEIFWSIYLTVMHVVFMVFPCGPISFVALAILLVFCVEIHTISYIQGTKNKTPGRNKMLAVCVCMDFLNGLLTVVTFHWHMGPMVL